MGARGRRRSGVLLGGSKRQGGEGRFICAARASSATSHSEISGGLGLSCYHFWASASGFTLVTTGRLRRHLVVIGCARDAIAQHSTLRHTLCIHWIGTTLACALLLVSFASILLLLPSLSFSPNPVSPRSLSVTPVCVGISLHGSFPFRMLSGFTAAIPPIPLPCAHVYRYTGRVLPFALLFSCCYACLLFPYLVPPPATSSVPHPNTPLPRHSHGSGTVLAVTFAIHTVQYFHSLIAKQLPVRGMYCERCPCVNVP